MRKCVKTKKRIILQPIMGLIVKMFGNKDNRK